MFFCCCFLQLGYTALHRAAAQGHLEVIKVLLTEACQIDKQDEVVIILLSMYTQALLLLLTHLDILLTYYLSQESNARPVHDTYSNLKQPTTIKHRYKLITNSESVILSNQSV